MMGARIGGQDRLFYEFCLDDMCRTSPRGSTLGGTVAETRRHHIIQSDILAVEGGR